MSKLDQNLTVAYYQVELDGNSAEFYINTREVRKVTDLLKRPRILLLIVVKI